MQAGIAVCFADEAVMCILAADRCLAVGPRSSERGRRLSRPVGQIMKKTLVRLLGFATVFVVIGVMLSTPLGLVFLSVFGAATGWFRIEDYMLNPT